MNNASDAAYARALGLGFGAGALFTIVACVLFVCVVVAISAPRPTTTYVVAPRSPYVAPGYVSGYGAPYPPPRAYF